MRTILILIMTIAFCMLGMASQQMLSVGGEFGNSWLTENSHKFDASNTKSTNNGGDLWNWGGKPLGYEVMNNKIFPLIAPTQWFYPAFATNLTPIVVNGTALLRNRNYMLPNFVSSGFTEDPWLLAQLSEQPVIVIYPPANPYSTLL
jgi:hypothetical protein